MRPFCDLFVFSFSPFFFTNNMLFPTSFALLFDAYNGDSANSNTYLSFEIEIAAGHEPPLDAELVLSHKYLSVLVVIQEEDQDLAWKSSQRSHSKDQSAETAGSSCHGRIYHTS
jgi:hypothetical protein